MSLRFRRWRPLARVSYALLGSGMAAVLAVLACIAPLTYDEAFTRFHYAQMGAAKTLVTYDYPNNHVPFTALVVLLPKSLVDWNPWSIRLVSVVFGAAMIAITLGVARWRRATPLVPLLLIAGSPTLIAYSFLARGYTFSAAWLALGAIVTSFVAKRDSFVRFWGMSVAGALLALGTWPMLTSVFVVPGWIAAVAFFAGIPAALIGTGAYAVTLALMIAPIVNGIRAAANGPWNANEGFEAWIHNAFSVTNLVAPCFFAALLVTLGSPLVRRERPTLEAARAAADPVRLAVMTGAMALSWYVVTAAASGAGVMKLPFARNSVPALWLTVVALVAAFPRRWLGWAVATLLLPGFVWSALAWSRAASTAHWSVVPDLADLNVLEGGTPASVRSLPGTTGATAISCTWYSEMGCDLLAPRLESKGMSVVADGPQPPRLPNCVVGSRRPPYAWQVTVLRGQKPIGVACY